MTTLATTPAHPLVEKYQTVLDEACEALATRSYYSRYPESPSPKVYGENAAADGLAAYQQHLDAPYAALASQPSDGTEVGSEVSPYGPVLGVRYPRLALSAESLWSVLHYGSLAPRGMPAFPMLSRAQVNSLQAAIRAAARESLGTRNPGEQGGIPRS